MFLEEFMHEIEKRWNEIKEAVRMERELSDVAYNTWIAPLQVFKVESNVVTVLIPSYQIHSLDYISKKFKFDFKVAVSEMMDSEYDIEFILENEKLKKEQVVETSPVYNLNYENAKLNPKYTFETFVVGGNNKFAHSASLAVAESPGITYNPLFLYGGPGLGKTHLMQAIGNFILDEDPDTKVLYVSSEDFTNEVIESIRSGNAAKMSKLRDKYRTVDVLMVDDVQFIIGKESTQEEFFHTFNALYSQGKQIILSSDRPPKEMETLEERFRSRFECGIKADIQSPDFETRMAILQKKAELETYAKDIDIEIIKYIATNIKSNIRELEGAFNKVIAFSKLNKAELSLSLAEEAIKDMIYPDKPKEITPSLIINVVAEHFGVSIDDIVSKKRNKEIALPRQVYMYLCRELTDVSLDSIGSNVGGRDHTTVMHGVDKIKEDINNNEELRNKITIIRKKIIPS